jgi:hypothetical protein
VTDEEAAIFADMFGAALIELDRATDRHSEECACHLCNAAFAVMIARNNLKAFLEEPDR